MREIISDLCNYKLVYIDFKAIIKLNILKEGGLTRSCHTTFLDRKNIGL